MFMKTYRKIKSNLVARKIKNETVGMPMKGFVVLKSKMYTFITGDNHESKNLKGINKNDVDDKLKYEEYKYFFCNRSYMRHKTNRIQSKNHNIGSHRINKIYLLSYDDKKFKLKNGYIADYQPYKIYSLTI